MHKKAKRLGKAIMRKVATRRKKVRLINDNEKQDHFQFVSVWLWSSKCFINPYIFKYKHETWYSLILILVSKFAGRKGRHCNGGPRTAQPPCAPVRKASQKSTVKEEDPVRKSLWANAHFIRNIVQSSYIFGVGTAFPHLFFQHYTPAYNNIFLFHSGENCDIRSWTTAVLQPAETFFMSQCNILRKANTAIVHYTVLVKHLLCNRAWQDILILFVETQICYFHMPGWQMKRH